MSETAFSLTLTRLLADRGRSAAWVLLSAVLFLGAWWWWAARAQATRYEVSSAARVELDAATYTIQSLLLGRVAAGLHQIVGARSRVFLARALLQGAEMVVLDERLAVLDPENMHQCLGCVLRRAGTVPVIAHP